MLTALRKALRRWVPSPLRRLLARQRRIWADRSGGITGRLALVRQGCVDWASVAHIVQPIRQSPFWQGKLTNLKLGTALIDGVRIEPGQVLSFWALVGQPTKQRGFAEGRSIRADLADADIGGGLCQLSGILYELGLRAGMDVMERHPHSRDLYLDETDRFTPLGLDATVVWPWKDLRLENRLGQPVVLRFAVEGMAIRAALLAEQPLPEQQIEIRRTDHADYRAVVAYRDGKPISNDRYWV